MTPTTSRESRERLRTTLILMGLLATLLLVDRALERTDWTVIPALILSALPVVTAIYFVCRDVLAVLNEQKKGGHRP